MKFIFSILSILFAAHAVQANVLVLSPEGEVVNGAFIAKEARVLPLETKVLSVGHGLREKKVSILKVKVYMAQLLLSDANAFVRNSEQALESAAISQTSVVRLSFLRNVEAAKVQSSFKESLIANGVEISRDEVDFFLELVANGGEAKAKQNIVIIGEKLVSGEEVITYQDTNGVATSVKGPAGFIKDILSIWLGVMTDKELESLKTSLIEGN